MTSRVRLCGACERPLPEYVARCPYCGEDLPTPRYFGVPVRLLRVVCAMIAIVLAVWTWAAGFGVLGNGLGIIFGKPVTALAAALVCAVVFAPIHLPEPGAPRRRLARLSTWLLPRIFLFAVVLVTASLVLGSLL